jgi:uncharacterized protein DUF5615
MGLLMGLRFLADHCVPNFIAQQLRDMKHEIVRLREVLPTESSDAVVIAKALLLSLNGDFADIVTCPPGNFAGIIALQMRNHAEVIPKLLTRLTAYLQLYRCIPQWSTTSRDFCSLR